MEEESPTVVLARYQKALRENQHKTLAFVDTVLDLTDYIINNKDSINPNTIQGYLFIFCNDLFDTDRKAKGGKLYRITKEPNYDKINHRAMMLLRKVYEDKKLLNLLSKENKALTNTLITKEDEIKRQQRVEQEEQEKAKRSRSNSSPDGAQRNPGSSPEFFKKQKSDSQPVASPEPEKKADSKPESNPEPHAYQSVPLSFALSPSGSLSRSSSGPGTKK